jgi:hypothetical protein
MKKEVIPKLLKALKTAKDVSAVNGFNEIRVPFRETDLIIEALEELELALDTLVYFEFDTPCEKMRDNFCEDYCMVKDEVGPDKECWLHYLTQLREETNDQNKQSQSSVR